MSNKPDWKDAPEWAKYMAMDDDGEWYWFENEPGCGCSAWHGRGGMIEYAYVDGDSWTESLEPRP